MFDNITFITTFATRYIKYIVHPFRIIAVLFI